MNPLQSPPILLKGFSETETGNILILSQSLYLSFSLALFFLKSRYTTSVRLIIEFWFNINGQVFIYEAFQTLIIYICAIYTLFVCLSVCLCSLIKHENGQTNQAQIFCGNSHKPKEGLWMVKDEQILQEKNVGITYLKNAQIQTKNPRNKLN